MTYGRWLLLFCYWGMLLALLLSGIHLQPDDPLYSHRWEQLAFRAAWLSIAQVPFVTCLSAKLNIISFLTGISYERLQWCHRWTARSLIITLAVHVGSFCRDWDMAGILRAQIDTTRARQGLRAGAFYFWTNVQSARYFRNRIYEFFVVMHVGMTCGFAIVLFAHVPTYTQHYVWLACGFVAFDLIGRAIWFIWANIRKVQPEPGACISLQVGHWAILQDLDQCTRVIIETSSFRSRPGQHLYVTAPELGLLQYHPFTIANLRQRDDDQIVFVIKSHHGFTKRLLERASEVPRRTPLLVFLQGPFGNPPDLRNEETVVFISNGTGASFNVPLFGQIARQPGCVRNVHFWWIVRSMWDVHWFRGQIEEFAQWLMRRGVRVHVYIVVTAPRGAMCLLHPDRSMPMLEERSARVAQAVANRFPSSGGTNIAVGDGANEEPPWSLQNATSQADLERADADNVSRPASQAAATENYQHSGKPSNMPSAHPQVRMTHDRPATPTPSLEAAATDHCRCSNRTNDDATPSYASQPATSANQRERNSTTGTRAVSPTWSFSQMPAFDTLTTDMPLRELHCRIADPMNGEEVDIERQSPSLHRAEVTDTAASSEIPVSEASPQTTLPPPTPHDTTTQPTSAVPAGPPAILQVRIRRSSARRTPPPNPGPTVSSPAECLCHLLTPLTSHSSDVLTGTAPDESLLSRHANIHPVSIYAPRARPAMHAMIRPAVDLARGRTAVVVCGAASLVADARACVARLGGERAVHNGLGALAIWLWAERGDW